MLEARSNSTGLDLGFRGLLADYSVQEERNRRR